MLALMIEDKETFKLKDKLYFANIQDIQDYIVKCYPYEKRDFFSNLDDNFESMSFMITNNNQAICSISIEQMNIYIEKNEKAWNGNTPIAEVFNTPNAYEIEDAFNQWIAKVDEDYIDSYRVGRIDDKKSMAAYNDLVTCCGSKDEIVEINNIKYSFGCNYGH